MTSSRLAAVCLSAALLAACSDETPNPPQETAGEAPAAVRDWPGEPRAGDTVGGTLAAGEEHVYRLPLAAGLHLRFEVDQQGRDLKLEARPPDGAPVVADHKYSTRGGEVLPMVAAESGVYLLAVRNLEKARPAEYRLRLVTLRPASAEDRRSAESYLSYRAARELSNRDPEAAARLWSEAAATWRELGDRALEGRSLARLADLRHLQGDYAAAAAGCDAAAAAFAAAGDRRLAAAALNKAAIAEFSRDEVAAAEMRYERALATAGADGEAETRAESLRGLGRLARLRGDFQGALDRYAAALAVTPPDGFERPWLLTDLGVLRARFLGDSEGGRALLREAAGGYPEDRREDRAAALQQLGRLAFEAERFDEARTDYGSALDLLGDGCGRALAEARLAGVEAAEGRGDDARRRLGAALAGAEAAPCRHLATIQLQAGEVALALGDGDGAEAAFRRCAGLYAERGDRTARAWCLAGVARARRLRGDLAGALADARTALDELVRPRPAVLRSDLRGTLGADLQRHYDLAIGLLLDLGRDEEAWLLAEQGRARLLADRLAEAAAGLRGAGKPALLARERELSARVGVLEERRSRERDDGAARTLAAEIDARLADLEAVRGELRRGRLETAGDEAIFSPPALRAQLADGELLLEYRLGDEESVLWTVGGDRLAAYRLPPRREVEALARRAARRLRSPRWPRRGHPTETCELARLLLAPAAAELAARPLVVVPDGELSTVSFAALPDPASPDCNGAPPLVAGHAISYLPSLATLSVQRRRLADRPPARGLLAVIADPVYSPDDDRLPATARGGEEAALRRLRFAGEEARGIVAALPAERTLLRTGPEASRHAVLSGALAGHRVVHFATHGVLDAERPLLSSLVLSRFDAAGRRVPGALLANEIYDLDLPAELVVLSACETALGRRLRGEGVVAGLPRAFLYAGAARVVVSLWRVDDRSTRDLMLVFYRRLVDRGLPPAQALREAQLTLQADGRPPHAWAGFVLQGDPRRLPSFAD